MTVTILSFPTVMPPYCSIGGGKLTGEGHSVRVVSLPSTDIFDAQNEEYHELVLPSHIAARIVVGARTTWYKYVGLRGAIRPRRISPSRQTVPVLWLYRGKYRRKSPPGAEHKRLRAKVRKTDFAHFAYLFVGCAKLLRRLKRIRLPIDGLVNRFIAHQTKGFFYVPAMLNPTPLNLLLY